MIAADGTPSSIAFTSESFEIAKQRAVNEGKLLFVDFYANWCTPCKWMDKTTFTHGEIIDVLNTNYVSIKVDIDTKAGFALKEKFAIGVLPTMLIFNSDGSMVERMQETLSKDRLLNLLSFHVHSDNKMDKSHFFNQSPNGYEPSNYQENQEMIDLYSEYRATLEQKDTYRLLVGDYNNYETALNKVNEIRDQFLEEIVVLNEYKEGKVWYKVLMGRFGTIGEADDFQKILQNQFDINTIVY